MPSNQMSAGSGKAAKFVAANPLAPMTDPFSNLDDEQREYQKALSENVNKRLENAMEDLKEKHSSGTNELDDPDRAPTGDPYQRHKREMERRRQEAMKAADSRRAEESREVLRKREEAEAIRRLNNDLDYDSSGEEDSDDELLRELEENRDPELERMRDERLQMLRLKQMELVENKAKGHGQYRMIHQDNFLPECTGSKFVAVHFFHKEFQRCAIMDYHLERIAPKFLSCKFVKIDAEKAPFFVSKLQVRTLPTLIVFEDGKAIKRLTGFEGLNMGVDATPEEPDKWHTGKLLEWLATTNAIQYVRPNSEILDEMRRLGIRQTNHEQSIWSSKHNEVEYEDDE
mmetsp:Transcript_16734/g.21741  ORF Transcript_16734/g.21741 Transcript_16734/m.21741 type:complete len:343 (-) Transcript_16734:133-1161(-)